MNWPIDTLTIQRFRGLTELTLEGLGGINLFIGDNNSGKTSVLEAISIYSEPMDPYAWRKVARRRVQGFRSISTVEGVKWLFPQGKQVSAEDAELFSGEIAMRGEGRTGSRDLRVKAQEIEEIVELPPVRMSSRRHEDIGNSEGVLMRGINLACELTMRARELLPVDHVVRHEMQFRDVAPRQPRDPSVVKQTGLGFEIVSPFDHGLEDLYVGQFRRAVVGEYKSQVIEALQRVDPSILDMEFLPSPGAMRRPEGALYLRHARSGRTPLSAFGDGVRRVLLMALTLVSARGGNLLIDEIETAIHVSVLGGVFQWLVDSCRKYDVQLFATTHSLEALDAILTASKDDLAGIVGHRFPSPEHAAPPKRYEGTQLSRLRFDRGLDVR